MDFQRKFISIGKDFLSDRKAVAQVGDTYSETFNLEVCLSGSFLFQTNWLITTLLPFNKTKSYLWWWWSDVFQTAGRHWLKNNKRS
jgi:hypothetical protein